MIDFYDCLMVLFFILFIRIITIIKLEPFKSYFAKIPQGDAAIYYMAIQFWRKHSKGQTDTRCLITKEPIYYPNLYETLVGKLFSDKILIKYSWAPNIIIFMFAMLGYILILKQSINTSFYFFYGIIIFYFWIDNVSSDRQRIHFFSLQPRYFGAVVCSFYFFTFIYTGFNEELVKYLQYVLVALALNISIFSRQCLVFVSLLLAIFSIQIDPIINLAIGIMLNLVYQGKSFVNDLICEFKYHLWYYKNYPKPIDNGNYLRFMFAKLISGNIRQIILYSVYLIMILIYFMISNNIASYNNVDSKYATSLFYSVLSVVLLTSLRKFACFGESFRYISFTSMFIMPFIVLITLVHLNNLYFDIIILLTIPISIYLASVISGKPSSDEDQHIINFFENLNKDNFQNSNWVGIPYYCTTLPMILGYIDKSMLFQIGNQSIEIMKEYFYRYPFLKISDQILKKHKITYILLDKNYMIEFVELYKDYFSKDNLIAENDHYAVYKTSEE